ncbi:MAG: efflux RND transporter periplasmic adaptor subunit [Psychromonas sp.]|nr:efflux RND transporter periplasmic adaptor subunit [Psychromonas sp.]
MTEQQPQQSPYSNPGKRKKSLISLAVILLLLGTVSSVYYFYKIVGNETTDDAYVNGNLVQITPEISGTVTRIDVDDGDYVEKGQELVRFDDSDAQISFENSKANLAQAVRQVRALFNNALQAKAVVDSKKIALHKAKKDLQRRQDLLKAGGLSQEELSHAQDIMNSAEKALAVAVQQLKSQQAMIQNTTVANHPLVKAQIAKLQQAYLTKQRTRLIAPVSGYIAKRNVQVGQRVSTASPLMAVIPLDQVWVDANFKETQLNDMRIGQSVTLTSGLYGDAIIFHGTVESLGIGTGSAFSLLPPQNATGNWIKVVQRLPVRIKLDKKELTAHPLRIGLSMTADIDTNNSDGPLLAGRRSQQTRYQTDIYRKSLMGVKQIIAHIIAENDVQPRNMKQISKRF